MWSVWANQGSTASHAHGLSDLWGRGSPKSDRPLTHTGRCSPILGAAWLISRLNALLRPVESDRCAWEADRTPTRPLTDSHGLTDRPHRFESPICEADLWGRERPWEAEHGLSDRSHDFVVRGRGRTPTASQIWESDRPPHAHRAMQSDPRGRLTDFTAKRIASAGRVRSVCVRGRSDSQICEARGSPTRPLTASQIGLSDRSDSLTDLTD